MDGAPFSIPLTRPSNFCTCSFNCLFSTSNLFNLSNKFCKSKPADSAEPICARNVAFNLPNSCFIEDSALVPTVCGVLFKIDISEYLSYL